MNNYLVENNSNLVLGYLNLFMINVGVTLSYDQINDHLNLNDTRTQFMRDR